MSTEKRMDKEDVVYIYTVEYCSAIKRDEIMSFVATRVDLEIITLSEVKSDKEKQIYDIAYMWNLKKKKKIQMNLFTKQKQTH